MRVLNSYHQQRLWFIDYFEKNDLYVGGPVYHNIPFFLKIDKGLDRDLLKSAVLKLVENNAVLRTRLLKDGGEIFQEISEASQINIDTLLIQKENLIENAEELRQIPFDFDADYLIKCYYENKQDHTIVFFVIHHAIIDRQSIELIQDQFLSFIDKATLPEEKGIQFYNFSNWQNGLSDEDLEPLLFHWKSKLKDLQVLYFSTDNEREQVHIYKANKIQLEIDADKVKSFCASKNTTPRSLFLAAYKMALARLTGLSDIVIGTWMDLRSDELKEVVGPVENLVVLRSFLDQQKSLIDLCTIVDQEWEQAENFKAMPFDKLVLELNPKKDMSRTALFDILYVYESKAESTNEVENTVDTNQGWGKYDFNLLVTEKAEKFDLVLTYNDLYFNQDTVNSLLDLVKRIVESVLTAENSFLKDIPLVSQTEYNKLVKSQDFKNDSSVSIVQLFAEQVQKHQKRTGVTWSSGKMNYEDLDKKSNQFAHYLIDTFDIKVEDKIAIVLPKSDDLIVSILGVLKAGAAYVPIDPGYPEDRKSFMIEDADCKLMVDAEFVNSFSELTEKLGQSLPEVTITGDNLAYIIYTSGTTGRPKGVMIEHGNVISLLNSCFIEFEFSEEDTWSFFHSYCFDFSIWEIFGALLTGGNVLVLSNEEVRNQELAAQLMADHNVTVFSQTPSAFYNFIALNYKVPSLRYVVFGGEALNPAKLKLWRESNADVRLINMYGITETTVHVTYKLLTDESLASALSNIGKPLAFANCYVLDQQQALLPYGRPGELYVSGQGVARGYLNRPEINAERFIACPFDEHEKMYRTGDLARFMPSGELEYLGRIDDQVKVRGYRIELDEIKKQIDSFASVAQSAITLVVMPDGDKSIAAYVAFKDNSTINDLKLHLSTKLPEYMIPAFIIEMDELPINSNGKLDKTKLPSPLDNLANNGLEIIAPSNQVETDLFEIWKALLNTDEFGIKHNFFDLGGHSLKATRLISAIHKEFNVRLELKQIFANPTLEQQALFIQSALKNSFVEIVKIEEKESYAISDAQRRLWVLSQFGDAALAYNISAVLELDEISDLESFKKAVYATVERHEILRTVFSLNEDNLVHQKVLDLSAINFSVSEEDFSSHQNAKDLVSAYIANDRRTPFDLENGPLLRASIIKTASEQYIFYYNMHHIISDGWSMNIIKRDILAYYQFYAHGKETALPELRIQYKDYAAWQLQQFSEESFIKSKEYWLNQLSGELPLIDLPSQKRRPNIKTYSGRTLKTFIAKEETTKLRKFVKDQDSTLFTGLLAIWNVLLYKYTGEKNLIIGSPVAGRDHIDLENQIGFFVNTLVLRNQIDPNETFTAVYNKIKEGTLKALENQIYPFDRLVEELNLAKDTSRNPVFDVMLILQNTGEKVQTEIVEDTATIEEFEGTVSKFDLEILFQETGDNLNFQISYNSDVYESETIKAILLSFNQILSAVLDNPNAAIKNINYVSAEAKNQLLYDFNATAVDYPKNITVIDLFTEQVVTNPDNIAVAFKNKELTYAQIDRLSSQLANRLQKEYGIAKDDIVGVQLDRSEWSVISVLAILKAGGVYIPIDSELPHNRKAFIIEDTNLKLLITEPSFIKALDFYQGNILAVDVDFDLSDSAVNVESAELNVNDLAYIIYTSGSTGNPKGVMIEHSSLTNYLVWAKEYYLKGDLANTNFGLFTSLSFDLTITSLFLPLISGGCLKIANPDSSAVDFLQEYFESEISCIKLTPAHISVLDGLGLKSNKIELAIVGGEELRKDHIAILKNINPAIRIINEYGPTEATVGCVIYEVTSQEETILIGRPIANTSIYIVDEFNNLQAEGITGEICIGGSGLARGYLNRADLTAEKFIANPFQEGTRIYKTGDLAKWLPDGNIEYQGRVDDQVKILGHRIELGEIETRLLQSNTDLKQAVVVVKGDATEKYLVAYYVSDRTVDKKVLKDNVRKFLPDYMVPGYYVALENIPLNSNGKVDRKRLPEVTAADLIKEEYVAGRSKEELLLVAIWSEVLKHDQISVKDNFYNLGGDSIKSIQVVSRLKQQGYSLKVEQLLRNPVIEDLAHLLEINTIVIDQSEVEGNVVLTPIQRHFFENKDLFHKNHYNQSVVLKSVAVVDAVALEQSIAALVKHHDALRMVYKQGNESWTQYNANASDKHYKINFYDLQSDSKELELEALKSIGDHLQSGFNLGSGILFHIGHFRMSDGDRLAFIVHHLVIDGISWRILLEDFTNLYQSYSTYAAVKLPLKTDSFQRWASLQEAYAKSDKVQSERLYWENVTNQIIPLLPTDHSLEEKDAKINSSQSLVLDALTTEQLQTQVHQVYNTEINDILLTGLGLALRDVFGIEKSILKMEGHGREEIIDGVDIGRTIGWFTSVYPFVLDVSDAKGYEVVAVKESLRKIPNKGIGYGILNYLDVPFTHELLPSIQFNYLGDFGKNPAGDKEESLFEFSSENIGASTSASNGQRGVLLDISGIMASGELRISIRYSSDLFNEETIAKLVTSYENQLRDLIQTLAATKQNKLTPSDLTYDKLSYSELSELNAQNNIEDVYELSPLQQGLYYHWLVDDSSPMYFEQTSYRLHANDLDLNIVKQAYSELINRYAILRTSFTNNYGGTSLQVVHQSGNINFTSKQVGETQNIDAFLQEIKEQDKAVTFDFAQATQMRLQVLDLGSGDYEFIWSHHHILMDGWCISILLNDFYSILMALSKDQPVRLPEPVKYSNYIKWLSDINKEISLGYWKQYLECLASVSELPFRNKAALSAGGVFKKKSLNIEGDSFLAIKKLCQESGITLNTFTQGVWGYLLSRYNTTSDVVFGSVVSGRPGELSGVENMVGLFINTIPVRVQYTKEDTAKTFLQKLHSETLTSTAHHYLNLSQVQSQSDLGMELINHLMVFENYLIQESIGEEIKELYDETEDKITIAGVEVFEQTNYDFNITVVPSATSLKIDFKYNTAVFESEQIENLSNHFSNIAGQFSTIEELSLEGIDYLSSEESNQLLYDFNDTTVDYPKEKTIIDLFEEQAEKTPNLIAVEFEEKALTYGELNEQANQLGSYLREKYKIQPDDFIGIKLERSEELIISILSILKSGAAYVPIDINYPDDRIKYIEEDTQCKVIVDTTELNKFKEVKGETATANLLKINSPQDLAYVIYTSGTTGKPKGVMVEHRSVVRLVKPGTYFPLSEGKVLLSTGAISFDATIFDFFGSLLNGAKLIITKQECLLDTNCLKSAINEKKVNGFFMTTAWFNQLVDNDIDVFRNIDHLIFGGEMVSVRHVEKIFNTFKHIKLTHAYGPTENTTFSLTYEIKNLDKTSIPIGKPIENSTVYILDEFLRPVPIGVSGTMYVAGDGLSRGYLNQPELTAERFVQNPFISGTKMYNTGDLGKWLPNGDLEIIGRIDSQVKIRGYRIELGEIENSLLACSTAITQVIVDVKEINGDKFLVAYYVSDTILDKKEIQNTLGKTLPDYMLPSYYIQLSSMPLTSNGKADKKALPEVTEDDLIKMEYIAPSTPEEKVLASVWSEVLKYENISIKDSFYNLGGDSIKSIQVVSRLKQRGYLLKVDQILRNPVLEDLAGLMETSIAVIDQSEVIGEVALAPVQHYFFESETTPNKNHFNQSVLLKSRAIDSSALERSIITLVSHHDALRMVYKLEGDAWIQYNEDSSKVHYKIHFHDLRNESDELAALNRIGEELQSTFDISSGILFHVGHFRMSDGDRLALIIHHLVIDGVSWRILLEDLSNLYISYESEHEIKLPLKTDSFQQWTSSLKGFAKSKEMQIERAYWEEVSNNLVPQLPVDYQEALKFTRLDKKNGFVLDKVITEKLQTQVHHAYKTEINDLLLTGLGLAIQEVFGIDKTVIKMEGHGREDIIEGIDIGRTVGWFTSVYPFVLDVSDSNGYEVVTVKESLRKIPNKGIGYGILNYLDQSFVKELIPGIQFNYLGDFGDNAGSTPDKVIFEFASESIGSSTDVQNKESTILLDISGIMVSGELSMTITYSGERYAEDTIEKLALSYKHQLINLIGTLSETKENHLTPSDLTYKKLTYEELLKINSNNNNNVEDVYELSPLQQGLYYHWLVDNSSPMYFEQISYRLHFDNLDIDVVKQAYDQLINRYTILRTSFTNDYSGIPLQIVHKSVSSIFTYEHAFDVDSIEEFLQDVKEKDKAVGFDLEQPNLMRLKVLDLGKGNYEFVWSSHHILMDGWCVSILINDFYSILMALSNHQAINLPEPIKYSTYIDWLSKIDKDVSLEYWKNYLEGVESVTEISLKKRKEQTERSIFKTESLQLDGELFQDIKGLCQELGITPNTFVQGVWGYLLSRYNNTQDVVFGSVVSGRPGDLKGVENMVGLFINTIPVRVKYTENDTPETFLKRLHLEILESTAYHYMSLSEVQSQSILGMELINNLIVFENYLIQDAIEDDIEALYGQKEQKITIEEVKVFEQTNYDFNITVLPSSVSLKVEFKFDSVVFDSELIQNLVSHFSNIAKQFSSEKKAVLDKIDYLTASDKKQLFLDFNDNTADYPKDKTIKDLFEEQVEKTPDHVAIVFEQISLTYKELNEQANQLGSYLRENYNIEANDLIGIKLERSERMIVAILGILKSGAAYIPIDPAYPKDRIQYIEKDSQSKVIVDNEILQDFSNNQEKYSKENIEKNSQATDLAYIIYTSGTTGNPKGVMIQNNSILNTIFSQIDIFNLNNCSRSLQFASFSFDASVSEIFTTFLAGKTLYVVNDETRESPVLLESYIADNHIDIATIPPVYLKQMNVSKLNGMKSLITAGEAPVFEKVEEYLKLNKGDYFNAYGPTETSICGTILRVAKGTVLSDKTISIGKPIHNAAVFITDTHHNVLPVGITGEICIGGNGLAQGYLNQIKLTSEKFIPHPYQKGERIYRTGDLGRWLPNGEIQFLGRIDDQVKINGYRIELEEIELQLKTKEDISNVAVTVISNADKDKELVAYIISDTEQSISEIRSYLLKKIPSYMIPSYYVQLDQFPLTRNGKLDKKALPYPDKLGIKTGADYVPPKNEIEEKLIKILSLEMKLDQDKISTIDNFFDLGMNSIKLIKFINRINQEFQIQIKPIVLFHYPNIIRLTSHLFDQTDTVVLEEEEDIYEELDEIINLMNE